jgi:hypothetical protein
MLRVLLDMVSLAKGAVVAQQEWSKQQQAGCRRCSPDIPMSCRSNDLVDEDAGTSRWLHDSSPSSQ